ncbi:major facilitator superfamily transporter [Colletotrichum paranaense]|nr:major facilitator superfamily transporter [Colletotrichum costaricense]XP_060349386.1 major facilitator superfamily transporter [Colletotrichum paranaense]KAK1538636.1 major facilitator superfamily transporter [Colletotrichum paranaense]KAK1539834.1 major facilitator superfamily transporter [Colletotrichum costaricense]
MSDTSDSSRSRGPSAELPTTTEKEKEIQTTTGTATATDEEETSEADEHQVREWSAEHDLVYPEGGWTAWSQVLAGNMLNALAWGYPATFGVYQLHYTETLRLPASQVSWIGSVQIFLTFAVCTVSGRLTDAGYARHAVSVGCAFVVFGSFMTSLCTRYWQIMLAQGICTGLGLGVLFMPGVAIIGSYFKKRRSLALAVSATGTGVGSLIFPSTLQYLIPQVGFPWAVRCSAFVALGVATIAIALLRPRLPPRKAGPLLEWSAFRELPYILYTLGVFFYFMALYFGFFYINTYARKVIGFSTTESVTLLLITNGMGIPIRPIVGWLADRHVGPINMFVMTMFLLGCMEFAWIGVETRAGMYAFSVFYGLSNGATQGVFVGSTASLTTDPQKMGTRFGMVATISGFATLAGPPIAGAIIDRSGGSYLGAQVWGGVMMIAGALTVGAARTAKAGKAWGAKL